jgi:ribosome-associated protein
VTYSIEAAPPAAYNGREEVEQKTLDAQELARRAVEVASDKQASDIVLLDLRHLPAFTEYFVICTVEVEPQAEALAEDLERTLAHQGAHAVHREGSPDSGWVLLDFGGLVVHIFAPPEREYYSLDKLWEQATPLVKVQ